MGTDYSALRCMVTAVFTGCVAGFFGMSFPDASRADSRAKLRVVPELSPVVMRNDRGGLLRERLTELSRLKRTGQAVRIEGRICFSTCTMFLGLPQTCVSPDTVFGFHGPTSFGRKLEPAVFDRASKIISEHYPPALKRWYMSTGRYNTGSVYRISGENIIALGVRQC